ncbi:MAG: 4Fe-4S binding protein [bacterium]
MRFLRRFVQLSSLFCFLYILYRVSFVKGIKIPTLFLRLDPLAFFANLSARSLPVLLFPALILLLLTLLLGRFFCGWICPWGTLLDIFRRIARWLRLDKIASLNPPLWPKYAILVFGVVLAFFGVSFVFLLDPLSLSTRLWGWLLFMPLEKTKIVWAGIAMVPIILLEIFAPRFWCKSFCPLGALFGLFSLSSLIRRKVTDDCIDCGKCQRLCPMSAIDADPRLTRTSECTLCWDCVKPCPVKAISFGRKGKKAVSLPSRRAFLSSLGLGVIMGILFRRTRFQSPNLIRPPGARKEEEFLGLCIRCGECIRACPTGGLRPAFLEAGWEGIATPHLVPRIGPCAPYCNLCSTVCPTGAISPYKLEDKAKVKIGLAKVNYNRCLPYSQGKDCLVCQENCSYSAINFVPGPRKARIPKVNPEVCVGCGQCENHCPVEGEAAIRVYRI